MIQVTITYQCRVCGSESIVRNGTNKAGSQQYHCKTCGAYRVLMPKVTENAKRREQILQAYRERASLRGVARIFGVSRHRVMQWLEAHLRRLPSLLETL